MQGNLDPEDDCFKPPPRNILVHCIHCGEEYDSYRIEWRVLEDDEGRMGFWCCPIEGCDGKGFGFDIFPANPEEGEEFGIMHFDDDDEEEIDDWDEEEWKDPPPESSDGSPPMEGDIPF